MFTKLFVSLLGIAHLTMAIPLENPSEDLGQYFDNRIVGGEVAPPGRASWIVGLMIGVDLKSFICGGSIITEEDILTAAHCITSLIWNGELMESFHGVVGTNEWQYGGQLIRFKKHYIHNLYNPSTYKYDVAVLKVKVHIKFGHNVAPIALNFKWVEGGEKSYVTGWGAERPWGVTPNHLKILYLEVLSGKECIQKLHEISPWGPKIDPDLEICTYHSVGNGMCHGDSGSPLVSVKSGKQSGIVAWGVPCAVGGPDVYTRIKAVKEFILKCISSRD